ncbi:intracellular serine protease [Colletotrichum incanum]|uniref:Intracellular serine protease n=1 Tax=Colletotrichum incanum TaxID=1573173 RepID=A0A167DPM6_COLIC|nr:intracellular serine protease [Colletotrichum incanum]
MSDIENRDVGPEPDDEEEYSDEEDDDITKRTKQAIADMKTYFNGPATDVTIDQFLNDHHAVVNHVGTNGVTFFHKIVQLVDDKDNESSLNASYIKPLFERLVKNYPYLLRIKDQEDQTALYRAIYLKRYTWKLVDYMLNSCEDPTCIEDALSLTCGKGESMRTCLTLAFEKNINAGVLRALVSKANENILGLPDGSLRNPFHYAVQYKQCTDERVDVIKLLLEKDKEIVQKQKASKTFRPVETFLDQKYPIEEEGRQEKVKYSVYNDHERTARAYLKVLVEERETKMREAEKEQTDTNADGSSLTAREKEPPKAAFLPPKKVEGKTSGDRDRASKRIALDSEQPKQGLGSKMDENEKRRLELRKKEEREHHERQAREEKKQRERISERDPSRPIPSKDPKERLDESTGVIPKIQTNITGTDHAPNTPLKRVGTQRFDIVDTKKKDKKTTTFKKASRRPDPAVLAKNSAQILRMLKLHYMRTRSIKMATSFLYGKNIRDDVQICFDYEGLPSEIQDHVFIERFGKDQNSGIRFDEVLMYVRFPIVAVKRTGRRAPKPRALGRQDMEFFFDWLYNKGVRRILKVEVDDSGKIPHSDEAIQISLEKIVVEHLDWQKTDLDPRVICQISSKAEARSFDPYDKNLTGTNNDLREVTLKWSGNNAVLQAWSELEGLPQLPKLEAVHLNIPTQSDLYDAGEWVQKNIEEFKVRLNRNANRCQSVKSLPEALCSEVSQVSEPSSERTTSVTERKIVVDPRAGKKGTEILLSSSGLPRPTGKSNPVTEHDWLNCTERFGGCMDLFWKRTVDLSREYLGTDSNRDSRLLMAKTQNMNALQNLGKNVIVALIDDGVDCCDSAFSGRVIEGKTFDYQGGGVGQYYISAKGHGTEMARMILKVCPMASIYSIRLKTHTSPDKGTSTIDAVSAALAIEAALEKNATIISMSWTLPVPPEESEEKRLLDSVLGKACSKNVLMFCSSPDQISATSHYPSAFRRSRFFLIGAAHDDGSAYGHAGKDNDFIFPGVNVNTSGGTSLPAYLADKTSSSKESTGSSIATALAAGLAAIITYCFKASALGIVTARMQQGEGQVAVPELAPVDPRDVDKIAQHHILKTAFNRLGKTENGQFIEVWKRFQPASQILEGENNYEDKLSCVTKLCTNLIEH